MSRIPLSTSLLLLAFAAVAGAQELKDEDLPFREVNGQKVPLFMSDQTFAGGAGFGWTRDEVELEATWTVKGIEGKKLHELTSKRQLSLFKDLRRVPAMEAFSMGFPLDEVPWSSQIHDVREGRLPGGSKVIDPYVWLSIESDRFAIDEERGRRRLSLGTDIMDDIYYDDDAFLLLEQGMSVRGRKRWDGDDVMRRLLIALKIESGVDEFGIKRAAKMDVREDMPDASAITGLDEAVQRGQDSWSSGGGAATPPLRRAWTRLRDRKLLRDSPTYKQVLALEPKAFIRSVRSRYHLNELSLSQLRQAHELGRTRLDAVAKLAQQARLDGAVPKQHEAKVRAFEDKVRALCDGSLVTERVEQQLRALGVADVSTAAVAALMPGTAGPSNPTDLADLSAREPELLRRKVVAEAVSALYHELALDLDDGTAESLRRVICRALDKDLEDHATWYAEWRREVEPDLRRYRTPDRFADAHAAMLDDDAQRQAYNQFGAARRAAKDKDWKGFEPVDMDEWRAIRYQLRNEMVRVWIRQLESAGSAARGLWFDQAREYYVPASSRQTGNFLIDTMDFSSMYRADVWGDLAPAERTTKVDLNAAPYTDKLLHAAVVNEVQIELTAGGEYTERLKYLRSLTQLPRYFMRWASSAGQADDPAAYQALFNELKALGDEELQAKLAPLNDYLLQMSAPVQNFSAQEFRDYVDPTRLRLDVRDDPNYSEKEIDVALAGARFVFEQYRDMLNFVARLKGPSVVEEIDDAGGPKGMTWTPADSSKGAMALAKVKALEMAAHGGLSTNLANNQADLVPVEQGKRYKGEVDGPNDSDFFKIEVPAEKSVTFRLRFKSSQGNLDLELLPESGAPLASSQNGGGFEQLRWKNEGKAARLVILRVHGAKNDYELEVR
ncbi:MAG: hypothetical protein AB7N76_18195 [Planctomycetota bacterium]